MVVLRGSGIYRCYWGKRLWLFVVVVRCGEMKVIFIQLTLFLVNVVMKMSWLTYVKYTEHYRPHLSHLSDVLGEGERKNPPPPAHPHLPIPTVMRL